MKPTIAWSFGKIEKINSTVGGFAGTGSEKCENYS
jgi:hypothetical protein